MMLFSALIYGPLLSSLAIRIKYAFIQCAFFKISTNGINVVLCSWVILTANDLIKYSVDCKCSAFKPATVF